jgi:hypothetical protein
MGTIYLGTGWSKKAIGEVDSDGTVYAGTGWSKEAIGKVEPPHIMFSGAALLLLLR